MIPIRLFTKNIELVGEFDCYESLQFTRSYFGIGSWQLVFNNNINGVELFEEEMKIQIGSSENKAGIITEVERNIEESGENSDKVTIRGFEMKKITSQRIILPMSANARYNETGYGETVMKNLVDSQMGESAEESRRFRKLKIVPSSGRGSLYTIDERYSKYVDIALNEIAIASGIGWIIRFDFDDSQYPEEFDVLVGRDLRDKVFFTFELDTLRSGNYIKSVLNYKNFAYVLGYGMGVERMVQSEGYAMDEERYETFVDAQSVQDVNQLTNIGLQNLANLGVSRFIKVTPKTNAMFQYETDWDLGDVVTVSAFDQVSYPRIIAVNEVYEHGNSRCEILFDREYPDIFKSLPFKFQQISKALNDREVGI